MGMREKEIPVVAEASVGKIGLGNGRKGCWQQGDGVGVFGVRQG